MDEMTNNETTTTSKKKTTKSKISFDDILKVQEDGVNELKKKQKLETIDDTNQRIKHSENIAKAGKYKGQKITYSKGTLDFMIKQNQIYLSQNKPAPYSERCLKDYIEGINEGK